MNRERVSLRKSAQVTLGVREGLGVKLPYGYFLVTSDSPEEANLLHMRHSDGVDAAMTKDDSLEAN